MPPTGLVVSQRGQYGWKCGVVDVGEWWHRTDRVNAWSYYGVVNQKTFSPGLLLALSDRVLPPPAEYSRAQQC